MKQQTKISRTRRLLKVTGALIGTAAVAALPAFRPIPATDRAQQTLDAIYASYSASGSPLLRENYPYDTTYRAGYLAEGSESAPNPYAYLWPFSGTLSAANALLEMTDDRRYLDLVDERILPGLQEYYDDSRLPAAYASYVRSAGLSDRFYDDNVWLGIDFAELYLHAGKDLYLDKAKEIWAFVLSGQDSLLGGGIYWCEQKKTSKNTCSNAPGAVFALRMYAATKDRAYLEQGEVWYAWTKQHLQDPADGLYWDNIKLDGRVDKHKFPYNSGQMLHSAVLLYQATRDDRYLQDAQRIAASGYSHFFGDFDGPDGVFKLLKRSDNWFNAVMLRGYVELYRLDGDATYLEAFRKSLDYAWQHGRDSGGLFAKDWTKAPDEGARKWLLDQAAMAEMYARIASLK